jgi:glycosyltransferase involved in cell wall biosynthesis
MRTIKALCITDDFDRPTVATFIGMHRAGINLTVVQPPSRDELGAELANKSPNYDQQIASGCAALSEAGVRLVDFEFRSFSKATDREVLRVELRDGGYDVLHVFVNKALQNGLAATKGLSTRIVAYRGIVGNVSFFNPVSWKRFLNPRIDRIVCVANAVRNHFLQMQPAFLRLPGDRLVTIYKGHSLEWYTDPPADLQEFGIPSDAFVIGCVGTYRQRKGVEQLIEAMAKLPEHWQVHLLLVGYMDGPVLEKKIAQSPVAERIHRPGYRQDAPQLTAACDVFVLPSVKREGLSRGLIEAMVYRIPSIVTNCGGNPELVVDGVTGLLVPVRDPGAISDAICRMYKDPGMRRRMGKAARDRIKTSFRIEDTIKQTIALYQSLV